MKNKNKRRGFLKFLVFFHFCVLFALSWRVIGLAELAIREKFSGALPYLTAIITPAWAAVATVIGFYFNKAKAENREKIRGSRRDC